MPIIEAQNINKFVEVADDKLHIIKNLSMSIEKGDSVAITGASGSGKSTLLGLLAGLDIPSDGSIILEGENLSLLDEERLAQLRATYMGFIFQSFQLVDVFSALNNVALPLTLAGVDNASAQKKAKASLESVGLGHRLYHYPNALSGGEQQRVAIARAFIKNPPILFADEPTGNLDNVTGDTVADLLFKLNEENNTTLILVTHDIELAKRCATQYKMSDGTLSDA